MIVIFIGGASGAGKSSLSRALAVRLGNTCELISMDNYNQPIDFALHRKKVPAHYRPEENRISATYKHYRDVTNFDRYEQYDTAALQADLATLNQGEPIQKRQFDFITNSYVPTDEAIMPPDVLIVEGLYAITVANELKDSIRQLTVFSSTNSYLELVELRIKRDMEERGLAEEAVRKSERQKVGPAFFGADHSISIVSGLAGADVHILNTKQNTKAEKEAHIQQSVDEVIEALDALKQIPSQNLSAEAAAQCTL